jgi:Tol biopolymer transport system component
VALTPGTRLGAYEILTLLGRGGMGEVYRAKDTKLGRDVALKILPDAFTNDPDRPARFRREAQVLASLNHPHIGAIYGLDDANSTQFLVLELVEGEPLDKRIARGAIPVDEALAIAKQIAEALEAAHEKGIIHRDLKPANIALTADGTVKVLDFGLAKAMEPASGAPIDLANSPTITSPAMMTGIGMILGTAAYMSPEQTKGRPADKRSDIWAFGCVLYEMLTGKRAFEGDDVSDTLGAVLRAEPDWSALPADVPEQILLLLKRSLERDRRTRVSDIGAARFVMTETFTARTSADASPAGASMLTPSSRLRSRCGVAIVAGAAGLALVGLLASAVWIGTRLVPQRVGQPAHFSVVMPNRPLMGVTGYSRDIAISPDGQYIVYRSGSTAVTSEIAVRALNDLNPRIIAGTTGWREPFMSPDGRWIGFFIGGEMRKVSITGGPSISIYKVGFSPRGATWSSDNTIIFGDPRTGLMSVPAGGGEVKTLTTADASKGEVGHFYPSMMPDGRFVLFTIAATTIENAQVAVLDLKTGDRKTLIRGASDAVYADSGHIVYAAAGSLRAVRFDAARLEAVGDPVTVVDEVVMGTTGQADYALSRHGTLVYVPGGASEQAFPARTLLWVDRQGKEETLNAPSRPYAVARLSPDGTRVALEVRDRSHDIWIWNIGGQTLTPLNITPAQDLCPIWTPDGHRVIWTSTRASGGGNPNLYWQSADGTGAAERLTTSFQGAQFPTSISHDGTRVALFGQDSEGTGSVTISALHMNDASGRRPVEPLLSGGLRDLIENGEISPDSRWIAYQSNESGQFQVYVRPFPKVDEGRSQISPAGGTRPMWARNGHELFYLDGNDRLTSVPVSTNTATFNAGTPTQILKTGYYPGSTTRGYHFRAFDISPDGKRFLMIKDIEAIEQKSAAPPPSVTVVLNWTEELKQRVPTK